MHLQGRNFISILQYFLVSFKAWNETQENDHWGHVIARSDESDSEFVSLIGSTTISNDGATIVKQLDVVHPAARALVDIAKSQDAEVCLVLLFAIALISMY